jgi:DNA primase large subunit
MYEPTRFILRETTKLKYGNEDLAKYTFLPEAGDYIRANEISLTDLASPVFKEVVKRAEERVLEAIKTTKVSDKRLVNRDVEIMSFPVALMLVRSTNLNHLMDRYSLAEAVRTESLLKQEDNEKIIEDIFQTFLGVKLERSSVPNFPGFKIGLSDYTKRAVKFHKPEWKLVNRIVQDGKVYVSQTDLIRLIREEIRDLILQRLKATKVPKLSGELDATVKKLIELTPPPRSSFTTLNIAPEHYPPCVKESLRLLEKGENVPHYGRFLMATYLLAVGKTVEQIMDLFPKSPDFKRSVTQYQVEHIAGIKGGRTKYSVPSCKTLQTHSFCFKDPVKCYEISSPLQYPSRKRPMPDSEGTAKRQGTSSLKQEKRKGWPKTRS